MLKIQRTTNGHVVFRVSGRIEAESIADLETLFKAELNGSGIVL